MNEIETGIVKYKKGLITTAVAAFLLASMFSAFIVVENASAHIDEGVGDPLQLYSYFDSDASTAIILDGAIARAGSPADEWDGGYAREINITDGTNYKFAYLLFANDDNYLYIGLIYDSPSATQANGIQLYFDEGVEVGRYDGSHNDQLDMDKENMIECRGNGPPTRQYHDNYFNDTGAWGPDDLSDTNAKEAWDDFDFNIDKGGNYFNWEVQIPLDPKADTPGLESDLNIAGIDEVGFYFRIWDANTGTWYYWDLTGDDPTDVNNYSDLRLGLEVKKDLTIYSTFANTGLPTIDGDLSGDFAWANAYERRMVLTNFRGETIRATLYSCEDPNQGYIYIGMVIYDDETTSGDYFRIYLEEGSNAGPFGPRNGILSTSPEDEHFQEIAADGTYVDGFFDSTDPGTWRSDNYNGPSNPDEGDDGDAAVTYKNTVGTVNDRYEFEFLIPYTPQASWPLVDGDYDLWIDSTDVLGILFRYHDESAPVGEQEFWWDFSTNLDKIQTQETAGGIYSAIGWAYLQTGAPALKPITPIDGGTVFGTGYIFRVEAEDEDPDGFDGITFVGFQVEGETTWISLARDSTTSGIWFTYWDTTAFADGTYNLTIVAQDNEGIAVKRYISITIANGGAAGAPPTVSLTMPAKGSTNSGTVEFQATTTGIASSVEFYVDDQIVGTMSNIGGDTWQFFLDSTFWDDGMHVVKVVAKNAVGEGADAGLYIFENYVPGTPSVVSVLPGQYLEGTFTFQVAASSGDVAGVDFTLNNDLGAEVISNASMGYNSASGYYEISVNTEALADGDYTCTAYAYDAAANTVSSSPLSFRIDNNAPSLVITSPMDNDIVSGSVVFNYTAVDTFLSDVMYKVDGNPWVDITTAWDTTGYDDGTHTVKIRARDIAGHESMETLTFIVDNSPPSIYINNPLPGQFAEGMYTFQVMAGDDVGIDDLRITITNMDTPQTVVNDVPIGYNSGTGYFEYMLDTTVMEDGNYNISAISYDDSGYDSGTVVVDFRIDNTAPDFTIVSPDNYAYVSGSVIINVTATDVFYDTTMYRAAGSGWTDIIEPWDTTTVEDGTYTVLIMASDLSGKTTTEQLMLTVDNNAPEIGMNAPVADQFVQDAFTFQVLAKDGIGVDEVRISLTNSDSATTVINDVPIGYNSGTGYYEYTLDTTIFTDGNYTFECTAYDTAGQSSGTLTVDFAVDNNAPILTLTSPLEGQLLSGPLYIVATAEDIFLEGVSYSVDGGGWVSILSQWDTTDLEDGTHMLSVMATDYAGHEVIQMVSVRTDNNGPELYAVTMPKENERVGSTFLIQLEVRDVLSVSEVTYRFDLDDPVRMFVNKETDFYEAEVVTDESGHDLTDGDYTLYIEATDAAGHTTELTRALYVDNSGPQITFSSPSSGQTVDNDVKFRVSVVDGAGVEEVFIRINKGAWMEMSSKEGSETYTYTWNSRQAYNGEYDVDIRAVDGLGNENQKSSTINVDNFPLTIFIIFIIVLVVLLILVVVSWSKGPKSAPPKKKKEAKTPEEEEEVQQPPEKAMMSELSDDEEDMPPPPGKASITEITEDSEVKEVYECPECGIQLTEFDVICPKCGVELADDEDKLEPPAPEEET